MIQLSIETRFSQALHLMFQKKERQTDIDVLLRFCMRTVHLAC